MRMSEIEKITRNAKPCPFCGKLPSFSTINGLLYFVHCNPDCFFHAHDVGFQSLTAAVDLWNKRRPLDVRMPSQKVYTISMTPKMFTMYRDAFEETFLDIWNRGSVSDSLSDAMEFSEKDKQMLDQLTEILKKRKPHGQDWDIHITPFGSTGSSE